MVVSSTTYVDINQNFIDKSLIGMTGNKLYVKAVASTIIVIYLIY